MYPPDEFEKIYPMEVGQNDILESVESRLASMQSRLKELQGSVDDIRATHSETSFAISPPTSVTQSVIEPNTENEGDFRHSSDFRSVSLHGHPFTLTSRQAQVIQRLYDAYQADIPDVSQDALLVELQLQSPRLRDIFKSTPEAWKRLIVSQRKGFFRLNL